MPAPRSETRAAEARRPREAEFETTVAAEPASLDLVQDLVCGLYDGTADDLNFTDRMRFETALVEIVGNVVEHGTPADGATAVQVHVVLRRAGRDLTAVVTDDGAAVPLDVDAATAEMPDPGEVCGRGLAMARALSSELRYERLGPLNRWTVRCSCSD